VLSYILMSLCSIYLIIVHAVFHMYYRDLHVAQPISRPTHGTRVRSNRSYAVRGSTAHQPTGTPSRYATSPLVEVAVGRSQFVCSDRKSTRLSSHVKYSYAVLCLLYNIVKYF